MNNNLPTRKNTRLKNYDYSSAGYYFITICTNNHEHLFGKIIEQRMCLSDYGKIVEAEILGISKHYDSIQIDKYVVMPNHVHIILVVETLPVEVEAFAGRASAPPTVANVVRGYKSGVTRKCGIPIWQRNYYERVIRDKNMYQKIWNYIEHNPTAWEKDCYYTN